MSVHGRFVGIQTVVGENFRETRMLNIGSWLLRSDQGRGIGTLMRQATLAFAVDELGAEVLESGAFMGNRASAAVSRKVGYAPSGVSRHVGKDGKGWREEARFRLDAANLVRAPYPTEVRGAEAFRRSIGLGGAPGECISE